MCKKDVSVLIDETQKAHINTILKQQSKIINNFRNLKREATELKQKSLIVDTNAKDNIYDVRQKFQAEMDEKSI